MPASQVALLCGVNVGRGNRVSMAALRGLVSDLGYGDVRTLLNSGNVVCTVPKAAPRDAASRIEKALAAEVGISARVTVLSSAEIATVIEENPLLKYADNPSRLLVALLRDPADRAKLVPLSKQDWGKDALGVGTFVKKKLCALFPKSFFSGRLQKILPGDYGAGEPPVPIPNTEVKPCRANGTAA